MLLKNYKFIVTMSLRSHAERLTDGLVGMKISTARVRLARLTVVLAMSLWQSGLTHSAASPESPESIALTRHCPPSFALTAGVCRLNTPYRANASLQHSGVGGPRSGLPALREGFTPGEIDLGRYLFFDPLLSKDNTMACSSCHDPDMGFADGRARSLGQGGQPVARNASTLWNVGFLKKLFWDARAPSLEAQAQGPLFDAHEMASTPAQLLTKLNANASYRRLFTEAFPAAKNGITLDQLYRTLTAFEASLISLNSRYDLYAHGFTDALNANEIEGMNIFRSFVARCAECHTPPLFTNQQIAVIGTHEASGVPFDAGAGAITKEPTQRGGFKVPTLRNITRTAPYNHAGGQASLRETIRFYTRGRGHAVPKGEKLLLHWHIWEPKLSDAEIDRLVDFMGALTDESFKPVTPTAVPSGLMPGKALH
jgi:cytochrome c peroxidase